MSYSLLGAALLFVIGAFVHSYVGEKLLLIPLLQRDIPPFFGSVTLAKRTLRMAWHLLSVVWLGITALLVALANPEANMRSAVPQVVLGVCVTMATLSLTITRGKHVFSWFISLAAALLILCR